MANKTKKYYNNHEVCMQPDPEVEMLLKSKEYQARHLQAIANNTVRSLRLKAA